MEQQGAIHDYIRIKSVEQQGTIQDYIAAENHKGLYKKKFVETFLNSHPLWETLCLVSGQVSFYFTLSLLLQDKKLQ